MLDDLYAGPLLEGAGAIPEARVLPDADATARRASKVCGSEVELDLSVRDGRVADIATRVTACALGQAAVTFFDRGVRGAAPGEVRAARDAVAAMLRSGDLPPLFEQGRWAELAKLQPVSGYPARHASVMLVFDAAVAALDEIERAAA